MKTSQLELLTAFEQSYGWQRILQKLNHLLKQDIDQSRRLGKMDGKSVEASYHIGRADILELVIRLPKMLRDQIASGSENDNTSTSSS